jgi:hypothetical protein
MAKKTKVTAVPFDTDGSLMHYPADRLDYSEAVRLEVGRGWEVPPRSIGPDWRPNVPFAATLRLDGSCRGRSAAYFEWKDEAGRTFPMFITDMADLVRSGTVVAGGVVAAVWMVAKRGTNYGVRLATDEETLAAAADSVA